MDEDDKKMWCEVRKILGFVVTCFGMLAGNIGLCLCGISITLSTLKH